MKKQMSIIIVLSEIAGCGLKDTTINESIIAKGTMPNLAVDGENKIHLVFGKGDSLLYSNSPDQGATFSTPSLICRLPKLMATAMRGPQIAVTSEGLCVTACNTSGNIFSFTLNSTGKWTKAQRINDVDTVARENLMALAAENQHAFAVWLDLRNGHNCIYGSRSTDVGKTWSKNVLIYASPDSTVCECCKPSVQIKGDNVYVMFRNWLKGSRDLYLIQSTDGGSGFGEAQKLGTGTWMLNGCPMDGGAFVINQKGDPETIWNRKGQIFLCEPGHEEVKLDDGKSCAIDSRDGKSAFSWIKNREIIVMNSKGEKKELGPGELPVIKAINDKKIICVWQKDQQIYRAVLPI